MLHHSEAIFSSFKREQRHNYYSDLESGSTEKMYKIVTTVCGTEKKSLKIIQINMGVRGNRDPHISHFWWK